VQYRILSLIDIVICTIS